MISSQANGLASEWLNNSLMYLGKTSHQLYLSLMEILFFSLRGNWEKLIEIPLS